MPISNKKVSIIGSGFSGLAAASVLAGKGFDVSVYEKNSGLGGRARKWEENGFLFDMGPSWYWMPDVFEKFFNRFGKTVSDFYELKRLDPSYRVWFSDESYWDIPAGQEKVGAFFESIEPGAAVALDKFLLEAKFKYHAGMDGLVYKPGLSFTEFLTRDVLKGIFRLQILGNFRKHIEKYFKNEYIRRIIEFPVLFLGAVPSETPALFSLMNYADITLGTWYPMGGMYKIVEAMENIARSQGAKFFLNHPIDKIEIRNGEAAGVVINGQLFPSSTVISTADYEFTESRLLPPEKRSYSEKYWAARTLAPSTMIFYLGFSKKLNNLLHHNLFFHENFDRHGSTIYRKPSWPKDPLFYVCAPSKTDPSVAPEGFENIFALIPVAPGLEDSSEIRTMYFNYILDKLEKITGQSLRDHIVVNRSYAHSDFIRDYHAFKGNAYGLANTLRQTAFMRPKIRSKKVNNLWYAGQLTVPGPGVPPAIISGQIVADQLIKNSFRKPR